MKANVHTSTVNTAGYYRYSRLLKKQQVTVDMMYVVYKKYILQVNIDSSSDMKSPDKTGKIDPRVES